MGEESCGLCLVSQLQIKEAVSGDQGSEGVSRRLITTLSHSTSFKDDFLAGELRLHQGGLRHQVCQDGGVDGQRGDGHRQGVRQQGVHQR